MGRARSFRLLALVASLPLAAVVGCIAWDVAWVRQYAQPGWIASRVDMVDQFREELRRPVSFEPAQPGLARVFVLGSSSVAVPDRGHFNRALAVGMRQHRRELVIDNFGVEGMTSWNIRLRAHDVLTAAEREGVVGDAAVLYMGHNDVTYTFHAALGFPAADPFSFPTTKVASSVSWWLWGPEDETLEFRIYQHQRTPPFVRLLQRAGLVRFDPTQLRPLVERTTKHFTTNLHEIVDAFEEAGVPLVVVTPIGFLAMEPYGPLQTARAAWLRGHAEEDPVVRARAWVEARDAEFFTSDLRAKTPMLDAVRALRGRASVVVCDIESSLVEAGSPFDETMFVDPLHFTDAGYDVLGGAIAPCVEQALRASAPGDAGRGR